MSSAANSTTETKDLEHLSERVLEGTTGLFQAIERDAPDERVSSLAKELWEITDAAEGLLETVDLERLPDVVDADALPDLIDVENLPNAIRNRDASEGLDLGKLRRAIELREFWNTVDLVDFREASHRLKAEIEDVIDSDGSSESLNGDSEAAADLEAFGDEIRAEAPNVALQQQAKKRMKQARRGVLEGHAALEEVYAGNRSKPSRRRRGGPRNPTAVSLLSGGPLPDSASVRYSSVPTAVRGAAIDPLPRIYGRRWRARSGSR
ncbi:hypothetical protein [Natronosalvus caseinilyticus]|uniref:hypothetical protein n=1 Tax=Natronosalvus caseinilyticus TaxID=2953747 RepID=UPI0028AAABA5|nr:hypothetical protein [Natronosalvus caseinilyticus]